MGYCGAWPENAHGDCCWNETCSLRPEIHVLLKVLKLSTRRKASKSIAEVYTERTIVYPLCVNSDSLSAPMVDQCPLDACIWCRTTALEDGSAPRCLIDRNTEERSNSSDVLTVSMIFDSAERGV
jgi:hypothetical protein